MLCALTTREGGDYYRFMFVSIVDTAKHSAILIGLVFFLQPVWEIPRVKLFFFCNIFRFPTFYG